MDFNNIEDLDSDQVLDLYKDILEDPNNFLAACYVGNRCVRNYQCYFYCDNGVQKMGVCAGGPVAGCK